jgi:hypothetical protein
LPLFTGETPVPPEFGASAIAGGGSDPGDGGPATQAKLTSPFGLAVDSAGNLLISASFRIRIVAAHTGTFYGPSMTAEHIYTIAGNGTDGFSGDGGPASSAELNNPFGLAVDGAGNVVIADTQNKPDPADGGQHRHLLRPANDRRAHLHDRGQRRRGFFGDGGHATGAGLRIAEGVAVDGAGDVLIADNDNDRIRAVAH